MGSGTMASPNRLDGHCSERVCKSVLVVGYQADLPYPFCKRLSIIGPVASQIEVSGRTCGGLVPQHEQHGTLQHKAIAMLRNTDSVQEALRRIALKDELEVRVPA